MSETPAFLKVIAFLKLIQAAMLFDTKKMLKSSITCKKAGYREIRFFFLEIT